MAHRLNALRVQREFNPGRYGDGNGLYLQVSGEGGKSWIFRYSFNGRAREMGLGSTAIRSLAEARLKAMEYKKTLLEGIDPLDARRREELERELTAKRGKTFEECAAEYFAWKSPSWSNRKHRSQWENTMAKYVFPVIGKRKVAEIDLELIVELLIPIWSVKTTTATRVRERIEKVLGYAIACGLRSGNNPATWRGLLEHRLPKPRDVSVVKHHPAVPYADIPLMMERLRSESGFASFALEFLILTAARTTEVLGAKWSEMDFGSRCWTIPAHRMKAGKEHRVPLSPAAIRVLEAMQGVSADLIFPGRFGSRPLSDMTLTKVLRRTGRTETVHGFRSSFRDWTAEETTYPNEVAEAALAHTIQNRVEAAYRRGDLFEKRRAMMNEWASFGARPKPALAIVSGESS